MGSDALICTNENKFFHIEYSRFKPYYTIFDTQIIKDNHLDVREFIRELALNFKRYDYILNRYRIVADIDGEITNINEKFVFDYAWRNWSLEDSLYASDKDILMHYLFELSINHSEIKIIECSIKLEKWRWGQQKWEPNIPIITGKKTPRKSRNNSKRMEFSGTARQHILSRDKGICQHCGVDTIKDPDTKSHIDHIIPDDKGGPNEVWNGQVLCAKCNLEKHANGKLLNDEHKLKELKEYYNIPQEAELRKVRGRYNYYLPNGKRIRRFTRNEIKKFR